LASWRARCLSAGSPNNNTVWRSGGGSGTRGGGAGGGSSGTRSGGAGGAGRLSVRSRGCILHGAPHRETPSICMPRSPMRFRKKNARRQLAQWMHQESTLSKRLHALQA